MTRRLIAVAVGGFLLATGLPIAIGSPAGAAPAPAVPVPCVKPAPDGDDVPIYRRLADHPPVTQRDLAALDEVVANTRLRGLNARTATPQLASRVTIPVRIHVVRGKHRQERGFASDRRIRRMMQVLNNAHAGKQSSLSTATRYRFVVQSVDRTTRDGWYHAYLNGPRSKRMMRALHKGGAGTLNLYLNGAGSNSLPVLGYSRFPWQQKAAPKLDGVVVNHRALPWGSFQGYNYGDTLVHEIGHWLGLFHTFQNGCEGSGDLVADTPAENVPSYACEVGRDSCPDRPGRDPVRNFMDYSLDTCMREFSAGQTVRMDAAFARWRRG